MHDRRPPLVALLTAVLVALLPVSAGAQLEEPEPLEEYEFELGSSPGARLLFEDPALGNGNAGLRLELEPDRAGAYEVRLEVFRHVPPEIITFALLVERIELVFENERGTRLRELELTNPETGFVFTIGDSADGYFLHDDRVRGLVALRRVKVKVFGNYE